jgi:hypothetical protein
MKLEEIPVPVQQSRFCPVDIGFFQPGDMGVSEDRVDPEIFLHGKMRISRWILSYFIF